MVLVGIALGTAVGRALRRWNRGALAALVEMGLVGAAAVAVGVGGTVVGGLLLRGEWSTDPAVLGTGPWLVAGIEATAAGELVIVAAASALKRRASGYFARFGSAARWLAVGLVAGPCLLLLGAGWGALIEWAGYMPEAQQVAEALLREQGWVQALAIGFVVLVAPLLEELAFRGWLLPLLARSIAWSRHGRTFALVATSATFASMHADAPWALPPLFVLGYTCGWLRLRSGSTWPGVVAHVGNNTLALVLVLSGTGA